MLEKSYVADNSSNGQGDSVENERAARVTTGMKPFNMAEELATWKGWLQKVSLQVRRWLKLDKP